MLDTKPQYLIPDTGHPTEPLPKWRGEPGVYEVPVRFNGWRLLLAVNEEGEKVDHRWVEQGGDLEGATRDLHSRALLSALAG